MEVLQGRDASADDWRLQTRRSPSYRMTAMFMILKQSFPPAFTLSPWHGSKLTRREVEQKLGLKGSEKEKKVNQVQPQPESSTTMETSLWWQLCIPVALPLRLKLAAGIGDKDLDLKWILQVDVWFTLNARLLNGASKPKGSSSLSPLDSTARPAKVRSHLGGAVGLKSSSSDQDLKRIAPKSCCRTIDAQETARDTGRVYVFLVNSKLRNQYTETDLQSLHAQLPNFWGLAKSPKDGEDTFQHCAVQSPRYINCTKVWGTKPKWACLELTNVSFDAK